MATKKTASEIFDYLKDKVDSQLSKAQKAATGKVETYDKAVSSLRETVKKLTIASLGVTYNELAKQEKPFIEAIKKAKYTTYKVQERIDEYELKEVKVVAGEQRIDLKDFCLNANLSTEWAKEVDKLRDLLEIREKNVFQLENESLEGKSIYYAETAKKKKEGETPDSNRQVVMLLQSIFDKALGEGTHKCTNYDIAFVNKALTRFNPKGMAEIATLNSRQFRNIFLDIFSVALGESTYKVAENKNNNK